MHVRKSVSKVLANIKPEAEELNEDYGNRVIATQQANEQEETKVKTAYEQQDFLRLGFKDVEPYQN